MAKFFEEMMQEGITAKNAVTWLTVELQGRLKGGMSVETSPVDAKKLRTIVKRIEDNTISGKAAKDVLDYLMENESSVDDAIEKLGLKQVSDTGAIEAMIDEILNANQDKVAEYRSGKDKLFGFFVGQIMKVSKGSANPQTVNDLLKSKLG
jgi:aspartyl-tRNA(Asn)/glutamyl-tRNA(Gln) amidotransferase subunit B